MTGSAKQSMAAKERWIASSQVLLAMTAYGRHFFTSGQRDNSSDWNASLPGMVAKSL
jgi:hypothetical protein